jgi:hypothetical protein
MRNLKLLLFFALVEREGPRTPPIFGGNEVLFILNEMNTINFIAMI